MKETKTSKLAERLERKTLTERLWFVAGFLGAMGIDDEIITVVGQAADRLESLDRAIRETLEEHRHLADGDDCTLIRLKRAIGQ